LVILASLRPASSLNQIRGRSGIPKPDSAKPDHALEKLADAAKPLYESLDDAQKGRFRPLLHIAGGKHWHHEHEGFRHS